MGKNVRPLTSNQFIRICFLIVWLLGVGAVFRPGSQSPVAAGAGGDVHGSVIAQINRSENKAQDQLLLPDITVFLKNTSTSALSPKVRTDLNGLFTIPLMPSGTYQLCYEAEGYRSGCVKEKVIIESTTVFPVPVEIVPKSDFLIGRLAQRDGRASFYFDQSFGVNEQSKVTLLDGANREVSKPVRPNVAGEFLIPDIPSTARKIVAKQETAVVEKVLTQAEVKRLADGVESIRLEIQNSSPKIKTFFAASRGRYVRQAAPGATVEVSVNADDTDGDSLQYSWRPSGAGAAFRSQNSRIVKWTLPKSSGLHSMYVLVKDGKGGYAFGKLDVSTSGPQVMFGGVVNGDDGGLLQGARVSVNGRPVMTNAEGYFFLDLPNEAPSYLLNVEKDGYNLHSEVLSAGAVGLKIKLSKSRAAVLQPGEVATFTEEVEQRAIKGAQVLINPGMRQRRGRPPLNLFVNTKDLSVSGDPLPGNFRAVTQSGQIARLESYGAVEVQAVDAAGRFRDLGAGQTITVRIPIEEVRLKKGMPPSVGLWGYDAKAGVWRREGTARRVGGAYEGSVRRLAVISAGLARENTACMRVHADPSISLPYRLQYVIPDEFGGITVNTVTVPDKESALLSLPPDEAITLEVVDASGKPIVLGLTKQTVNSGAALPLGSPLPAPPYTQCGSDAFLSISPTDHGFLDFRLVNDETYANNYYKAIDEPGVDRSTLDAWKKVNGFDTGDDASAVYFNNGDLGFGRSMHMKKRVVGGQTFTAYYVSNYKTVEAARIDRDVIATVAMEFSPGPGGGAPFTKFFVFNNNRIRDNKADLDDRGAKFIPGLCMICHSGRYPLSNDGRLNSRFIAFDLESFLYSGFNPASSRASQEPQFKLLNASILDTNVSAANKQLIEGWYGGSGLPSPTVDDRFFPPDPDPDRGWGGHEQLYSVVVKTSCRSCHVTRDSPLDWASFGDLELYGARVRSLVCGPDREMPNAKQTYINFWASTNPHRPDVLVNGGIFPPGRPCPAP